MRKLKIQKAELRVTESLTSNTKADVESARGGAPADKLYRSKELSWLSFNHRVLQEAADPSVPLLERLRFLGIFSSNLDEFFRVRVATLQRLLQLGKRAIKLIGESPKTILDEIQEIVLEQHREFDALYQDLTSELASRNIFIISERELDQQHGDYIRHFFRQTVRPHLMPLMINQIADLPPLRDQSAYLAIRLARSKDEAQKEFALIEIPTNRCSRFVLLPPYNHQQYIMLLDDVIRFSLNDIFSVFNYRSVDAYAIKLTRDAELDLDDDLTHSYVEKVMKSLKQRKAGNPVRFVYDAKLPDDLFKILIAKLGIEEHDTLVPGARYHNFRDFMNFPDLGLSNAHYEKLPELRHRSIKRNRRLMETIRNKDLLLHYPYQSFDYVIDLLREASIDPKVSSIRITIYRAGRNSSVINALINAARNGKAVTAILELQARFDEEANLQWGNLLQDEGVRVIYGVPGLKVHSKLILITRRSGNQKERYAVIGTGNFNEDTARMYTDYALFTADPRITSECHKVFSFYYNNYKIPNFKHLLVSPFNLRKQITRLIRNEIRNVRAGKPAFIHLKLNNLVDGEIIRHLYEAGRAGVEVRLIVRSMFSMIVGKENGGSNVEAISIVDRFLEHSRLFVFGNNGSPRYFISSADLMPRNLEQRVEVASPIFDPALQAELKTCFDIQWRDNVKARILNGSLDNQYRERTSDKTVRSQIEVYEYLKKIHG